MSTIPLQIRNTETDWRYGYCFCGCGERTGVAKYCDSSKGWYGGVHHQYRNGHYTRSQKRYEVDPATGCWNWLIGLNPHGYAMIRFGSRTYQAHSLMYRTLRGEVPVGLELDHLCRNRRCINPAHLEPVTHAVNNRRGCSTKLTEAKAAEIRILLANGYSHRKIAAMFGVEKSAITSVGNGRTWVVK